MGRSFYSPDLGRRQTLGEGLESWRGFYQSIRPTQMGLSLNIGMISTLYSFAYRASENGRHVDYFFSLCLALHVLFQ